MNHARRRRLFAVLLCATPAAVWACGGAQSQVSSPSADGPKASDAPPGDRAGARAAFASPPTVEEARAFLEQVDKDVRRLWVARDQAGWVSMNFITGDTEALAANGEAATAAYMTKTIQAARRFDGLALPDDLARKLHILSLSQTVPAPSDPEKRQELAGIVSSMTGAFGKATYCSPKQGGKCMHLDELSNILARSRSYDELLDAWKGWHETARPLKERYARYVELGNEGAREIGFKDMGALWRSGYDMTPEAFEADIERVWQDVKPLYDDLHCYVRARLRDKYGKEKVPEHAPIPAHLLGNMWAQEWNNVLDLVTPYKGEPSLDVGKKLVAKKVDPRGMVKLGESFFTSLGFDPLPKTFWERSLFTRPQDREVVCHASAWDVTWSSDLRIKMCIKPDEEDLVTIHHELGHDFYFQQYTKLPILFQQGANDGFHEGIGDTLALSVTPKYLQERGLLDSAPNNPKALLNQQMKQALEKVSFLPFGLLIDKWRWDVLGGKTTKEHYNQAWWDLRLKYQGIAPAVARTEADFDPGSKFHVPNSTPYVRYFLARIYQFQFHRALCKAAGFTGPLDQCSIYGNKAAGEKLRAMLALGASRPWQEALVALGGEGRVDASALIEYFAPLQKFLKEQNKAEKCGW